MLDEVESLLTFPGGPPFIFLHHPHTAAQSCLPDLSPGRVHAYIDAIEHNTPRLIYSGTVSRLRRSASGSVASTGEISTWDGFARELQELHVEVTADKRSGKGGRGKGKERDAGSNGEGSRSTPRGRNPSGSRAKAGDSSKGGGLENGMGKGQQQISANEETEDADPCWVVAITHAERLPRILGSRWAVITRLSELVGIPVTVILASQTPWDTLRPPLADAPEPVHIYLPAPTRAELTASLLPASSHPLWPHFINLLLASFSHLVSPSLAELTYLASPLWTLYTASLPSHLEQTLLGRPLPQADNPAPALDITVKLLTDLKYQISLPLALATEHLLTRQLGPREFVSALRPSANPLAPKRALPGLPGLEMPLVARYLVVSAYAASQNPPKTDLRLFGRGLRADGTKRRGGGTRRAGYGRVKVGKVPQRLVGPKPFPLDRLLAIFSSLYAEHAERPPDLMPSLDDSYEYSSSSEESDASGRAGTPPEQNGHAKSKRKAANGVGRYTDGVDAQRARVERKRKRDQKREERWEEEVEALTMGVQLWSMIPELEAQGLLKRVSPPDRLDNIMLRCEVDYETAKTFARALKIPLDEYLYEATA